MSASASASIDEFRKVLRNSKKIVVLSGAGLSAASGNSYYPSHAQVVLLKFHEAYRPFEKKGDSGEHMMF
jgi:NAD-dependent SIR2 family protein deacetylase